MLIPDFDIPYTFGWHINAAYSGSLVLGKPFTVGKDKGFFVEIHGITGEESSMYFAGRFPNNPNDSWGLVPNLQMARLLYRRITASVEIPRISPGTRLRYRTVYDPSDEGKEIKFFWDLGLGWQFLGSQPGTNVDLDFRYILHFKTLFNCSRLLVGDLDGNLEHDWNANLVPDSEGTYRPRTVEDENKLYDSIGECTARTVDKDVKDCFNRVEAIVEMNSVVGSFQAQLGQEIVFKTSPGFEVNTLTFVGPETKLVLETTNIGEDTYSVNLPITGDGVPYVGTVELIAESDTDSFSTPMQIDPPEGFVVQTYKDQVNINERSLTYKAGRHPRGKDQLLFKPSDTSTQVDAYNNLTLKAAPGWLSEYYVIDRGGCFKIDIYSDRSTFESINQVEPEPDDEDSDSIQWFDLGSVDEDTRFELMFRKENDSTLVGIKKL